MAAEVLGAGTAIDRELSALLANELAGLWRHAQNRPLYHYTKAEYVLETLQSGLLRAYCIEQMNDAVEVLYAVSIARAIADRKYAIEPDGPAVDLLHEIRQRIAPFSSRTVFALSFSEEGDDAMMWNLYANRGRGVGIRVPFEKARSWALENGGYLVPVFYKPSEINAMCTMWFNKIRNMFLRDLVRGDNPNPKDYADALFKHIIWLAPIFKPKQYADEKEWRMVFYRDPKRHLLDDGLRAYVELPDVEKNPIPLEAVCLGPKYDRSGLREFEAKLERFNVPIQATSLT